MGATGSQSSSEPPPLPPRAAKDMSMTNLVSGLKISLICYGDTCSPSCTGLQVLGVEHLLCADWKNRSLKMVHLHLQKVSDCLTLSGAPWDVALLPNGQLAVTLPYEQKIVVISNGNMSVVRKFSVGGECWGISCAGNKLVVSYINPAKVELLSLEGEVLNVITGLHPVGLALFSKPRYVTTTHSGVQADIYVSDCQTNIITKLSMNGDVVCQYKQEGSSPGCIICLGGGNLAVCLGNRSILLLKDSGVEMTAVQEWSPSGVECPQALAMSRTTGTLYVSNESNNYNSFVRAFTFYDQ